ncbi:hypothetical protein D3C81_1654840 [compost metagenome]
MLDLSNQLGCMLQLLYSRLMTLQSLLDHLACFAFTVCNFFKLSSILLFLLKKLLIVLAGLLCLGDQLLNNLLTLVDLAGNV